MCYLSLKYVAHNQQPKVLSGSCMYRSPDTGKARVILEILYQS